MTTMNVFVKSQDGFSLAYSRDLPGFNLCVSSGADLGDHLVGAIEWFMKQNKQKHRKAPVFPGTRIPIRAVKRYLAAGYEAAAILTEYPELTEKDIHFAKGYNAALAA